MSTPLIDIRSLRLRRNNRDILDVERLQIQCGEVVVILGPNGAGKSTFLKCLLGFSRPTSGEIEVFGQSITAQSRTLLRHLRCKIGYVPQILAAQSETPLTVREVIAIGRTGIAGIFHRLTKQDWQIVDSWIDRLGLTNLSKQSYSQLSGGEQRKVLIGKAMVQQPEILLLDEPTVNLDLFSREQILETLSQLHSNTSVTILLVCHELEAIPACSRRLLILREGKIIADGPPEAILTSRSIEKLYGIRLTLSSSGGRYAAIPQGNLDHD